MTNTNPENNKGEYIINTVGGHHKFQLLLALMLLSISTINDFYAFNLGLMLTPPMVIVTSTTPNYTTQLNDAICDDKTITYYIDKSKTRLSWAYEEELTCENLKKSILSSTYLFGIIFGSILLSSSNKIGTRKQLLIVAAGQMCLSMFLLIKNYYAYVVINLLIGCLGICVHILCIAIITEFSDSAYRAYFVFSIQLSGLFSNVIYFFLFDIGVYWKYTIIGNFVINCGFMIAYFFYSVETPSFYLNKKDEISLVKATKYIAKMNSLPKNDLDELIQMIKVDWNENKNCDCNNMSGLSDTPLERSSINSQIIKTKDCDKCREHGHTVYYSIDNQERNSKVNNYNGITNEGLSPEVNNIEEDASFLREVSRKKRVRIIKLSKLIAMAFFFFSELGTVLLEIKNYSNYVDNFFYYTYIIMVFTFSLSTYMMNTKFFGRKYTFCLFAGIIVISKLLALFVKADMKVYAIFYLVARLAIMTACVPFMTMLNESLSSNDRIKYIGIMFCVGHIASASASFAFNYMSFIVYNTLISIVTSIVIILAISLPETFNVSLEDK